MQQTHGMRRAFYTIFSRRRQHPWRNIHTNHGRGTPRKWDEQPAHAATVIEHSRGMEVGSKFGPDYRVNMFDVALTALKKRLNRGIIQIGIQKLWLGKNSKERVFVS